MESIVRIVEDSQQPHLLGPGLPADALLCQEVDDGVEVIVAVQLPQVVAGEALSARLLIRSLRSLA